MPSALFPSVTGRLVSHAMDGAAIRHRAHAQNLANVDTPGYRARAVTFEQTLRQWRDQVRESGARSAAAPPPPREVIIPGIARRSDGNTVDIEQQMAHMAANSLTYETLVALTNMRGSLMKTVINEGR